MRHLPLALLVACAAPPADDATDDTDPWTEPFPRCAASDPLRRPYFGDTHVHTRWSLDASTQGTRLGPADAYRFAKGEAVGIQPYDSEGVALRTVRLDRPLDFVAVADHAEFLGLLRLCETPGSPAYDHTSCVQLREDPQLAYFVLNAATALEPDAARHPEACGADGALCREAARAVWDEIRAAADAAYDTTDACGFTSFAAWEWSAGPGTKNLHRNVIFRSGATTPDALSYFDAPTPEGLWDALEAGCSEADGCDVLAIPHNSNLSSGLMFRAVDDASLPPEGDAALARRARMEPLVEVFQHKGDSECWPGSPASDEACGFEKLPYNTLSGANLDLRADPGPRDFVRDVLGEGLRYRRAGRVNPYVFGLLASTDTHLGTPGLVAEAGYPGHGGAGPGARDALPPGLYDNVFFNPGGLAVLWAEENSREALFRAMRRREAYGTSGPRIVLRAFAGWDLPADACDLDPAARAQLGYAQGVPMGSDLGPAPTAGSRPELLVWAEADPGTTEHPGADLQRLQLVRGTLSGDTPVWETLDLAGSATTGLGLDLDTCAPDAGVDRLCAVWTDEAFDPEVPAFWYPRVLEVPTCRWQTRQCAAAGITCPTDQAEYAGCCELDVPASGQERAWGSPVWAGG